MPDTTYTDSEGTRTQSGGYVYDTATGTWVPVSPSIGTPPSSSTQDPEDVPSSSTGEESSSEVDSKTEADKEYIEVEFNTLVGELVVSPSKKTIRIKVNDTVDLVGLGSHLSGKYFVSAVKRTLDKDSGYSQTITVIKNGFDDSLKKKTESSTETTPSRLAQVVKSAPKVSVGDSVKIVGTRPIFITGDVIPAWVRELNLVVNQISTDGSRVFLMPISAWTYSRYVQKE